MFRCRSSWIAALLPLELELVADVLKVVVALNGVVLLSGLAGVNVCSMRAGGAGEVRCCTICVSFSLRRPVELLMLVIAGGVVPVLRVALMCLSRTGEGVMFLPVARAIMPAGTPVFTM